MASKLWFWVDFVLWGWQIRTGQMYITSVCWSDLVSEVLQCLHRACDVADGFNEPKYLVEAFKMLPPLKLTINLLMGILHPDPASLNAAHCSPKPCRRVRPCLA
jgi:hypothetical protein